MNLRSTAVLLTLLAAAACTEPLEFADWTIPVPEGTRIVEYAAVALQERTGKTIQIEKDLIVGNDGSPEATFYRPAQPVVDSSGRIYVLDRGNFRVQVFGPEGDFLLSFGHKGQGPGEFAGPVSLGIVGDRIAVADRSNSRVSVFSRSGEYIEDLPADPRNLATTFIGTTDGTVLVSFYPARPLGVENPEPYFWSAARRELGGETLLEYIKLPYKGGTFAQQELEGGGRRFFGVPMPAAYPLAALGTDGRVYATASDQYQVLAMGDEGQALWALRVAMPAALTTEAEIQQVLDALRESRDGLRREQVNWPDQHPVVAMLQLDGAGNLFVFLYSFKPPATTPPDTPVDGEPVPVDVYGPEGERIFAGFISIPNWSAALGDHVYRLETDPATNEPVVVRYRLFEPF